jgi:hypothetical protein
LPGSRHLEQVDVVFAGDSCHYGGYETQLSLLLAPGRWDTGWGVRRLLRTWRRALFYLLARWYLFGSLADPGKECPCLDGGAFGHQNIQDRPRSRARDFRIYFVGVDFQERLVLVDLVSFGF